LVFIDFQQALVHHAIWKALKGKCVPQKIISIIKGIYDQSTCNVLHKNRLSKPIPVLNGVKQGCTLSPLLFNVTLHHAMSKVSKNSEGIRWGLWGKLTDLNYTDDICMSANPLYTNNAREIRKRIHKSGF
jgi:hypothetical protein